jgi:hypothetical protein
MGSTLITCRYALSVDRANTQDRGNGGKNHGLHRNSPSIVVSDVRLLPPYLLTTILSREGCYHRRLIDGVNSL